MMNEKIIKHIPFLIIFFVIIMVYDSYTDFINTTNKSKISSTVNEAPKINSTFPPFNSKDTSNVEYNINKETIDRPMIINFWASWCGPCHDEIPTLNNLYDNYSDKVGFYSVATTKKDSVDSIIEFINKYQMKIPVLIDSDGSVFKKYSIRSLPTTFLINKNGTIIDVINGIRSKEDWERKIKAMLPKSL